MGKAVFSAIMLLGGNAFSKSYNGHQSGWGMHDYGGGGYLMSVLLLVLLGVIVFLVIRQANSDRAGSREDTPIEILKKRYARGEISKEDYEKMKNDLS